MSKIAKIHASIPCGYTGHIIEVESALTQGLPNFTLVGLGGKAISEARERVRNALKASGLDFPDRKLTVNLAPAELKKDGVFLDLPIAISILAADNKLDPSSVEKRLFVGELSLDGHLRPVRGIINIIETAREHGFKEVILPEENLSQAALVQGPKLLGFKTLRDVFLFLRGQIPAPNFQDSTKISTKTVVKNKYSDTFAHIYGQDIAKRALTIAVAGHHNILFSGPPGAGKTLLARAALDILPPPSSPEKIEITKLYSLLDSTAKIATSRPFRSPHHSASLSSLVGGGPQALPGEISLAHHGVLFLDELPEYPRSLLESLRQPLEDRQISISRSGAKTTYPANFMLIATMNPCPCGFSGDPTHECTCTPGEIMRYQNKLSGPLLDRIDLIVKVERVKNSTLLGGVVKNKYSGVSNSKNDSANTPQSQVTQAITRQCARYGSETTYNASLTSAEVATLLKLSSTAKSLLDTANAKLDLSARTYFKIIKVAQTIADLDSASEITPEHIAEALSYRAQLRS